jgi:hypothetical protein
MRLTVNKKTLSSKNICLPCKRALQKGKFPQFATPNQIRHKMPLQITRTLSKLEERLVSLIITFTQIRKWGYK